MGRNRFVKPLIDRLPLSDGDWIDVKHELNAGEVRRVFTEMIREQRAGSVAVINPERVGITKMLAYIVAWSFMDDNGPVPFSEAALTHLDQDTFREIMDAVDAHETRTDEEREERKKKTAGEKPSSVTSLAAVS